MWSYKEGSTLSIAKEYCALPEKETEDIKTELHNAVLNCYTTIKQDKRTCYEKI